jgi:hypothetical protein
MKHIFNTYKIALGFLLIITIASPNFIKAQAFTDAVVDSVIALPVDFIEFTSNKDGNNAILKWNTANEKNNSHFNVLKSFDGVNFETIATVNPSSSKKYSYTDKNVTQSILYYKIENVDRDGKVNYSNIVSIKFENSKAEDWNIYPNPVVNNVITIQTKNLLNNTYKASLIGAKGESVFVKSIIVNSSNSFITIQLPENIGKGMYILNLNSVDGKINSSKKVIIK